jgi:outer membrane protein assembly factor BamB
MTVDDSGVVVTTDWYHVGALDTAGRSRWTASLGSVALGTPAADRRHVLVGGRRRVTALRRRNGRRLWWRPMSGDVTSVSLAGDVALAGDQAGTLTAFDAHTGAMRWSVHEEGRIWSAPRVDRATGVVLTTWHWTTAPAIRAFDLATGALRWEAPTGRFTAAPVVRGRTVVVATGQAERPGLVDALDLATGAARWSTPVPGSFEEAVEPATDGHDVVVVDHGGIVTLLDLDDGTVRWQRDVQLLTVETRMSLTQRRVVFTTFSGDLFVLDRADGRVVTRLDAKALGGYPIAAATTAWPRRAGILVALRYDEPYRVVLLPLR